jgi:cyanophycin synthetase
MLLTAGPADQESSLRLAKNFRSWQRNTIQSGLLPVIAIGGTRGKSTVVRMLDHIFRSAHLRTATWTNLGIEVRGRRQQGELAAWSTSLSRIAAGTIDVAIQELHWSTVNAVGLPPSSYPVVGITTLWPEEEGEHNREIQAASLASERMALAVHDTGLFVGSGDDYRLTDIARDIDPNLMITARSRELPALQLHFQGGGAGIWHDDDAIRIGDGETVIDLVSPRLIRSSFRGRAMFQLSNAMAAASIAYATGISLDTIRKSLTSFEATADLLPASFNIHEGPEFTAVVNRMETPGITRSILRATNPRAKHRQITVLGDLASLAVEDCLEIGRMLGRNHGAILLHSQTDESRVEQMRRGIAGNQYPPLIIHLPTERRALNRAFQTIQPDDVMLVLTSDDGRAANRAIARQIDGQ